jgi:hypothetical protein
MPCVIFTDIEAQSQLLWRPSIEEMVGTKAGPGRWDPVELTNLYVFTIRRVSQLIERQINQNNSYIDLDRSLARYYAVVFPISFLRRAGACLTSLEGDEILG